jgi:hypothetical protein
VWNLVCHLKGGTQVEVLCVIGNSVLRITLGPKWDEVAEVGQNHIRQRAVGYEFHHIWLKSKAVPLHANGGAWGKRKYSSYSFFTTAIDRGEWSASCPCRALAPGKGPPVPMAQDAGWATKPFMTQESKGKILLPLLRMETQLPGRPVRSQTLYWLSHPGSSNSFSMIKTRTRWTCSTHGDDEKCLQNFRSNAWRKVTI